MPVMSTNAKYRILLVAVVLFAVILRVAFLFESFKSPAFDAPRFDAGYHDYWARGLVTDDWTPPAFRPNPHIQETPYFRPPGYPYFLAGLYWLFNGSLVWARVAQLAMGVLNSLLAYCLGTRLFNRRTGLYFCALMATYWSFIYFENEFLEPVLLISLNLTLYLLIVQWEEKRRPLILFLAGLAAGLCALTRPNVLLLFPLSVFWIWYAGTDNGSRKTNLTNTGVFLLGAALAISPATIRNLIAAHDFVLISSNAGINLYIGNNETADGYSATAPGIGDWSCFEFPLIAARLEKEFNRPLRHSEISRYFAKKAVDYASQHPAHAIRLACRKALLFWGPMEVSNNKEDEYERVHSRILRHLPIRFPHVTAISLIGLFLFYRNTPRTDRTTHVACVFVLLFIFATFVSYLPFLIAGRYRVPIVPSLLLFASYGIDQLVKLVEQKQFTRAAVLAFAAWVCFFVVGRNYANYQPDLANYYYLRGAAYVSSGHMAQGIEEFEKCLQVNPSRSEARENIAAGLLEMGRYDEATQLCAELLQSNPNSAQAHFNMGLALYKRGLSREATAHFREVLRLSPDYGRVYFYLGTALANQGLLDEAAVHLNSAVLFNPGDPKTYFALGLVLAAQGHTEEAIKQFTVATQMEPKLRVALEAIKPKPGDPRPDGAIIHYTYQVWNNPHSAEALSNLTSTLRAAGRTNAAISQDQGAR